MIDDTHSHAEARRRWIAAEKAHLAQEGEKVADEPAREDRFRAIRAVMSRREAVNTRADIGIGAGKPSPQFENDGDQDRVVNTGSSPERVEFVGSMVQADLHRVVGTIDGRGVPGASKEEPSRRGDRNLTPGAA